MSLAKKSDSIMFQLKRRKLLKNQVIFANGVQEAGSSNLLTRTNKNLQSVDFTALCRFFLP